MEDKIVKRFMALFDGLDRAYGVYALEGARSAKGKEKGKARTVIGTVDAVHYSEHLDGNAGLGIVPIRDDGKCTFGAIDVDVYSGLDIEALSARIKKRKLPLTVCRSKSGGAHLILFMKHATPCSAVRKALLDCSLILDFAGSEIFPKQENLASKNDVGNWINLPYFDALRTTRYAIVDGAMLSIEQFLDHAESSAVTEVDLFDIIVPDNDILEEGPPCLQALARNGIPEGHRNDTMFSLGVYAKLKFPEVDEWSAKLEEYNQQFFNPPLPYNEVATIQKTLTKKDYYYKCKNPPLCNYCNKDLCLSRKYGVGDGGGDHPSILIDKITEITTTPKIYIVEINGVRIQMSSEELTSQAKFGRLCLEAVRNWPTAMKPRAWQTLINNLVKNCEIIDAPDDASPSGQLSYLFEQFCTTRAQARQKDELLMGKPWTDEGLTYFRSNDFKTYLAQQKFFDLKMHEVYVALRNRHEVKQQQFKIKGKCVRCWSVPQFVKQNESHEPARLPESEF